MFDSSRTEKEGDQHFDNERISGICLRFYAIADKGDRKNLFGVEVVIPQDVRDEINWDYADEESEGTITMGQLMETVSVLCKQAQLHPNCMEVMDFSGNPQDVSGIGMEQVLESLMSKGQGIAKEQFEHEKARGMIPDGMTFDDWLSVAGPDDQAKDRMLN